MFVTRSSKILRLACPNLQRYGKFIRPMSSLKDAELNEDEELKKMWDQEFKDFKSKQMKFQEKDGVPIHLKCGGRDKILFFITIIAAFFGFTNTIGFVYNMACPKKNNQNLD